MAALDPSSKLGAVRRDGSPAWGIAMIALGLAAIVLPTVAGIGVLTLIAALLIVNGAAHAVYSLGARRLRSFAWHAGVALLYLGVGVYVLLNFDVGLASLALLMGSLFVLEGALILGGWWMTRRFPGATWMLLNGIMAIALGVLILVIWPDDSGEIVGLLLGVNLLMGGVARLMHRPAPTPV